MVRLNISKYIIMMVCTSFSYLLSFNKHESAIRILDFHVYVWSSPHLRIRLPQYSFASFQFCFCHISSLLYTHWTKIRFSRCKHFTRFFYSVKICWFSCSTLLLLSIFLYFYVYLTRENLYRMLLYFKNYNKKI